VIGIVLAAGAGRRLAPLTDDLPKTLLPVDGDITILDIALSNLAAVGITDIHVVSGFASHQIESRVDALEQRHGVKITMIFNDKALIWNNAYSLWLARDLFAEGVLLCNGDTVHPASVEKTVLAADSTEILIALDDQKQLAEEEMKVILSREGLLTRINKAVNPADANGEYIGVTRIEPAASGGLADALKATWERDTNLYYEDGYQEYADRGGRVEAAPIGVVSWVEVDNHDDLARAREIACHY
jgi:choline kinase